MCFIDKDQCLRPAALVIFPQDEAWKCSKAFLPGLSKSICKLLTSVGKIQQLKIPHPRDCNLRLLSFRHDLPRHARPPSCVVHNLSADVSSGWCCASRASMAQLNPPFLCACVSVLSSFSFHPSQVSRSKLCWSCLACLKSTQGRERS